MSQDLISVRGATIRNDVTELGYDKDNGLPVVIGDEESTRHTYINGVTGSGKSTLLINRFIKDIQRGQGGAFITPDGDAIRRLLARIPHNREQDIVYINPGDIAFPFGLNLLFCDDIRDQKKRERAAGRLMHVFKRLWGPDTPNASWGPRLENMLSNCIYALMYHGLTLAEIPSLLLEDEFREKVVGSLPETGSWRYVRLFWQTFEKLPFREQEARAESTYDKILSFLNETVEHIVGQEKNTIDFFEIMQQRKILLVYLHEDEIGSDEGKKLLGTLFVAQLLEAALARERIPEKERQYFSLFCDEFQEFASDDFHKLLTRARKYKVKVTVASQVFHDPGISEACRRAVENAGTKISFQLAPQDAPYFAPIYAKDPPPGEWIYEKQMRRAANTYQVEYWEPKEAEEEYTALGKALSQAELDEKIVGTYFLWLQDHYTLDVPPDFKEVSVYSGGSDTKDQKRVDQSNLDFTLASYKAVASRDPSVSLQKIADNLSWLFMPDTQNAYVRAFLLTFYEQEDIPLMYERKEGYSLRFYDTKEEKYKEVDMNYYIDGDLYVQKESWRGVGSKNYWKRSEKPLYVTRLRLRADIKPGVGYTFPTHYPSKFEQYISGGRSLKDYPYWIKDEGQLAYADSYKSSFIRELRTLWKRFAPYAQYYFDFHEYEKDYNDVSASLPLVTRVGNHVHEIQGNTLMGHWKGPYFHTLESWREIVSWLYKKIAPVAIRKAEIIAERERLWNECHKVETRTRWLGWYEPEPVMEWEYVAEAKAYARDFGKEFMVGDNTKYKARQGPSPYTIKEMRDRVEQELLRLPVGTAYCQIINLQAESDEEAVVRCKLGTYQLASPVTNSDEEEDEEYQERKSFVIEQTHRLYCRLKEDVTEEILKRRTEWTPEVEQPAAKQETPEKQKSSAQKPQGGLQICPTCGAENDLMEENCVTCGKPLPRKSGESGLSEQRAADEVVPDQQAQKKKSRRG